MNFSCILPGWSRHWSAKALRERHQQIGDRAFMQGYRMRAYADSDYVLPNFDKALELGKTERLPDGFPADWVFGMGVDLASDKRPGNALFVGSLEMSTGIMRPCEIQVIKASSPRVAQAIGDLTNRWRCQAIMVENNAYQGAIIDWISDAPERFPWYKSIIPFTTGRNKADARLGVPGMDVEFMNGAWHVPAELNPLVNGHAVSCQCGPCKWVSQMRNYPHGADFDIGMASWFFREICRAWKQEVAQEDEFVDPIEPGVFRFFEDTF